MYTGTLYVVVSIRVKMMCRGAFLSLVAEHRKLSRQEPGCLSFQVCQDLDDPLRFVLNEQFTSRRALQAHQQTEHYAKWRSQIGSMEAEPRARREWTDAPKIVEPHELVGLSDVVFTNGCFDGVLHAGHLHTLQWAKSQGSLLVVGVNDDDSVRRLKGPDRPRAPLAERMKMLAALTCVDFVTHFTEDTPENLIRLLAPKMIVKGFDWQVQNVASAGLPVAIAPPCKFTLHTSDLI